MNVVYKISGKVLRIPGKVSLIKAFEKKSERLCKFVIFGKKMMISNFLKFEK